MIPTLTISRTRFWTRRTASLVKPWFAPEPKSPVVTASASSATVGAAAKSNPPVNAAPVMQAKAAPPAVHARNRSQSNIFYREKAPADDGSGSNGGGGQEAASSAAPVEAPPAYKPPPLKYAGDRSGPSVGHPTAGPRRPAADPRQLPADRPPPPLRGPPPARALASERARQCPESLLRVAKRFVEVISMRQRSYQLSPHCCQAAPQSGQGNANSCSIPNEFLDATHEVRDCWKSVKKIWDDRPGVRALRHVEGAAIPREQRHDNLFAKLCGEGDCELKPVIMLEGASGMARDTNWAGVIPT